MDGAGAQAGEGLRVFGDAVALVAREAVAGSLEACVICRETPPSL